jgi:hypothetical protein
METPLEVRSVQFGVNRRVSGACMLHHQLVGGDEIGDEPIESVDLHSRISSPRDSDSPRA